MISKIVHYAADAVLVSAVLAGIKRSTYSTYTSNLLASLLNIMLSVATNKIESEDVRSYVEKYLTVGEWVVDQGSAFMSASQYFERKR
ncbi:hypothetical protein KVV02_004547 [Mortierella alpina]|uniref:DUF1748-domain-containing protein n=1 Tax=Mortierella alpina TaxID=64518 RepID=A0A9P8A6M4_MORAP|nr:hypothetical protein KVV02_004547 [Mortierella alpina]